MHKYLHLNSKNSINNNGKQIYKIFTVVYICSYSMFLSLHLTNLPQMTEEVGTLVQDEALLECSNLFPININIRVNYSFNS